MRFLHKIFSTTLVLYSVHQIVGPVVIIGSLQDVVEKNFVQLTYTDAVELLLKAKKEVT